jgi:MFS family permease
MRYPIQRLTFGGILDQAFRLMRDHFVTMTSGFVMVYVPYAVALAALPHAKPTASPLATAHRQVSSIGGSMLALFVFALCAPLAQLLVTAVITDLYLGQPTSLRAAARRARANYRPYLGTTFLMGIALCGAALLFVLPALYLGVCWSLVGPVAVVEGIYGQAALTRSRALVKGYFGRTLGVLFVATFLVSAISAGLRVAFAMIPWLGPALTGAVQGVCAAYASAVVVVLYVDLRSRHEDFDLQLLAAQVANTNGGEARPVQPAA